MRLDIHVHSNLSDGTNTIKEIVEYAKKIGLNGISITDHNEISGSLESLKYESKNFKVIPGIEISAKEGHILCHNVTDVPKNFIGITHEYEKHLAAKDVVQIFHDLGAIVIAAHPYDLYRRGVGDLVYELDFDAIEVINGHTFADRKDPVKVAKELGLPMTGGSDAHCLKEIGNVTIELNDDFSTSIKSNNIKINSVSRSSMFLNHVNNLFKRKILKKLI